MVMRSNSINQSSSTTNTKTIVIVGGGDLALGLSNMYECYAQDHGGYKLLVAEPLEDKITKISSLGGGDDEKERAFDGGSSRLSFHNTSVDMMENLYDVWTDADVIILALPAFIVKPFVTNHLKDLMEASTTGTGVIVVDATNPNRPGQDFQSVMAELGLSSSSKSEIRWVRAFNDNGAVEMMTHKVTSKRLLSTKICGPSYSDVKEIEKVASDAFGFLPRIVPFNQYDKLALHQTTFGKEWILASTILTFTFAFTEIYSIVREHARGGEDWYHLPLKTTNHALAWTCITGFALAQIPGMVAKSYIAFSVYKLPDWLKLSLGIRKHLGLVSLFFLLNHTIISLILYHPGYSYWASEDSTNSSSNFSKKDEVASMFGSFAFACYGILGICSLPSVAQNMTSNQWQFVYGPFAWTCLGLGTAHNIAIGTNIWTLIDSWPDKIPHQSLMSALLPMLAIAMKICQSTIFFLMKFCKTRKFKQNDSTGNSSAGHPKINPRMSVTDCDISNIEEDDHAFEA